MTQPVVAVLVAAGSGTRLGGEVPKALVRVAGRTLVEWSMEAMAQGGCDRAVVVAAASLAEEFRRVLAGSPIPVVVTVGGERRQDSVANGLELAGEHGIVLVHDAARPFVPAEVVRGVITAVAQGSPCVIPVVPVVDTIRERTPTGPQVVDRSRLVAVQTPQGFDLDTLRQAHAEAARRGLEVTDDAAVCEALGHPVHLVAGSRESNKVTEPLDVLLARAIAAGRGHEED
ncbi:2-C-methyl-D-erythritol 4-phosphate cytidylyltransferase [Luteococcus peritonei]|uniref:2-C-methyl-D-erythritol 4-phosphate cytidylyltransferase n=1 Tax=Luteococcus peritonei TaxID=88874 RepID=A0ABW4RUB6_9ACTN